MWRQPHSGGGWRQISHVGGQSCPHDGAPVKPWTSGSAGWGHLDTPSLELSWIQSCASLPLTDFHLCPLPVVNHCCEYDHFLWVLWVLPADCLAMGPLGGHSVGFPGGASGKEPTCQCRRSKRRGCDPRVRKIPCSRKWQLTPVFLPGEFHGQGPGRLQSMGSQESDTTEQLNHLHCEPAVGVSKGGLGLLPSNASVRANTLPSLGD